MPRLTFKLGGDTRDASSKLADVTDRLDRLTKFAHSFEVKADDLQAISSLKDIDDKLKKIARRTARAHVSVSGIDRADMQLDRLAMKLDHISEKSDKIAAEGLVGRLLGSGIGPESKLGGGLSLVGGIGLAGIVASLIPALVPLLIGGGVGAAGAIGAFKLSKPTSKLGSSILSSLEHELLGALTSGGTSGTPQRIGGKIGGDIATPSFVTGLDGILKQISGFVKTLGPQLGAMFRSSIPYLQTFVQFMEQAAKTLLPAFTQDMREFQPYLPTMAKGLNQITLGLAGFLRALGPGMKASSEVFLGTMTAIRGVIVATGATFSWLADVTEKVASRDRANFDHLRAWTRDTFDGIRHDVAAIWNALWAATTIRVSSGVANVIRWIATLPGRIVSVFASLPGRMVRIGEQIINGVISGVESAAGGLLGKVSSLASDVSGAFAKVLHILSPSRVFRNHGKAIIDGLTMGLDEGAPRVRAAMHRLANHVNGFGTSPGMHPAYAGAGSAVNPGGTIRIEFVGGSDSELWTALKRQIRIRGGNPSVLGR
jgi:hypothetical protein